MSSIPESQTKNFATVVMIWQNLRKFDRTSRVNTQWLQASVSCHANTPHYYTSIAIVWREVGHQSINKFMSFTLTTLHVQLDQLLASCSHRRAFNCFQHLASYTFYVNNTFCRAALSTAEGCHVSVRSSVAPWPTSPSHSYATSKKLLNIYCS
jgi:hypothetical protein